MNYYLEIRVVSSSLKQSYLMTLIGKNRRATSAHFPHFLLDDVSRAHMAHRSEVRTQRACSAVR